MNRKAAISARILTLLALILALALCSFALADTYDASTMRLLRYQGDVEIFDPTGMPRFVLENVRFASGEAMRTGVDGQASVGLDDSKIVTLDTSSRVEFVQESGHIQLKLTEGTLFLDVQEKLDENESLDIQTTTMTVGIRGTIVFVRVVNGVTTFGVLEGKTQVGYTDTAGSHRVMDVSAGQMVTIQNPPSPEADAGVAPVITDMVSADIQGFVADQVLSDENCVKRVTDGSENGAELLAGTLIGGDIEDGFDFPADGEWVWNGTITLVAQSASKLYDGKPLTRPSDVLVYGLPDSLSIHVAANGTLTNAGTADNPIAYYSITNATGDDVTSHFPNIKTVSGTLKVDPIPVTVWTGSAEKYYDGEPLTCEDAELKTAPGYVYGDPEWRNTSLVTRTALGSETMISAVGVTWVHGTNPITGDTKQIALFTGQRLSVCLHNEDGKESLEFVVEDVPPNKLPEDILRLYADNPDLLAQACEDAGWDPEELETLIAALPKTSGQTVTRSGVQVSRSATEDLMTDSTNVRITIDTDITDYNNRPLNGDEAHFTPIELEPSIKITAIGSQTEVGESENTYTIDWGGALASNYEIIGEELGTLTVHEVHEGQVNLTAASVTKTYDGKPLTDTEVYVNGLPDGFTFTATVEGSQTDAGESANRITEYAILDEDGEDVTEAFPNLKVLSGKLTVEPAPLTVTTGSAEKIYDGTALSSDEAELSGLIAGETAAVTATGSQTSVGESDNPYSIEWGTAKADNYTITESLGTLTVEALAIDLNCGGAEVDYSGSLYVPSPTLTYLNGEHAGETVTGTRMSGKHLHLAGPAGPRGASDSISFHFTLFTGDTIEATISGLGKSAGTYTLTGAVSAVSGSVDDFDVSFTGTTLTIAPIALTITTPSDSKVFDGTALTGGEATVTGLVGGDEITVTCTGEVTDVGSADNTYTIDWGEVNPDNYVITEELGTLTVTPCSITITSSSASREYMPSDLTNHDCTVEGLPDGFTYSVDITGAQYLPGTSANTISGYTFYNQSSEDVTEVFTDVTLVEGTLTVTKKKIDVWTDDVTHTYTGGTFYIGIPHTLVYDEDNPTTSDLKITNYKAFKDAGTYEASFDVIFNRPDLEDRYEIGTVTFGTVIVNPAPLTITTTSASKAYDGTPLEGGTATVSGLKGGETITVTTTSITDVGSVSNDYTIDWGTTKSTNYTITEEIGTLTVKPVEVAITIQDTEYTFNNGYNFVNVSVTCDRPFTSGFLGDTGYYVTTDDARIEVQFSDTAKRKNAGVTELTGTVSGWSYGNPDNYSVTVTGGTLTVHPQPVTVTTSSASKAFDGTPLTSIDASITGFTCGEGVYATANGTITDVGSTPNTYSINWNGWVPENYTITEELGTLTVTPLTVEIDLGGYNYDSSDGSFTYNGSFHGPTVSVSCTDEDYSVNQVSDTDWNIVWDRGDVVRVHAEGGGKNAGTYTLTYTATVTSGKSANYTFTASNSTLKISSLAIRVYVGRETSPISYDGQFHGEIFNVTCEDTSFSYTLTQTDETHWTITSGWGDTISLTINGGGRDAGSYSPTFSNILNPNFTLYQTQRPFTIDKAEVTVTTGSKEEFSGSPMNDDGSYVTVTDSTASITGLVAGETATVTATGRQEGFGESTNTYEIDWGSTNKDNYTIKENLGTLKLTYIGGGMVIEGD